MLAAKTPPSIGDAQLTRVIRQIYNDINEIIAAMPQSGTSLPQPTEGKAGDIRITKQDDNTQVISLKAAEGWIKSGKDVFTEQIKTD